MSKMYIIFVCKQPVNYVYKNKHKKSYHLKCIHCNHKPKLSIKILFTYNKIIFNFIYHKVWKIYKSLGKAKYEISNKSGMLIEF